MNFFVNKLHSVSDELIIINSMIDIIFSVYITITFYDGSTRSKILSIFLMPLTSISYLLFGLSLGYWDFIRIPALLYLVVHYYNRFREHTKENNLDKLILLLVSIIYIFLIFTLIVEDQNPINAVGMVSNAFTSNGYAVLGKTPLGVLISTILVWSGYLISGVATASLAATIVLRKVSKKFEKVENKQDNFEKIIIKNKEIETDELKELKRELKSIHDENAELKREMVELKELIKNK